MSTVHDLNLTLGAFNLRIPKWEIADNGITVLRGPSGSGKSSIVRALLGLQVCPTLKWDLNGQNVVAQPVEKRNLAVVFQNYELFPHMTARENIAFACKAKKISSPAAQQVLKQLSEALRLESCLDTKARVLSGGEQQRVALARALVGHPQFLFLDEPFSALDSDVRAEARALVKGIIHERKIPTLLISHDNEDIKALADHVVHIEKGQLRAPAV